MIQITQDINDRKFGCNFHSYSSLMFTVSDDGSMGFSEHFTYVASKGKEENRTIKSLEMELNKF